MEHASQQTHVSVTPITWEQNVKKSTALESGQMMLDNAAHMAFAPGRINAIVTLNSMDIIVLSQNAMV